MFPLTSWKWNGTVTSAARNSYYRRCRSDSAANIHSVGRLREYKTRKGNSAGTYPVVVFLAPGTRLSRKQAGVATPIHRRHRHA
jgi:hypothetical protein